MMPVRAWESGVWVACADKWGSEDGTIVYAGQSNVIDPAGTMRACAPSSGSTVLTYQVEPVRTEPVMRRPALYRTLTRPTAELPITRLMDEPIVPTAAERRVAVVPDGGELDVRRLIARYEAQRAQDTDLVVFAGMSGPEGWQVELPMIEQSVQARGGSIALAVESRGCSIYRHGAIITPERTMEHTATHGRGVLLGEGPAPVVATPAGIVGLLVDEEGEVPEVARCLALNGAEILAWPLFRANGMTEAVARTRSDENRVYVAAAWEDGGLVTAPGGAVQTTVPAGTGVAMADTVNLALARAKTRAPGTNVILNRVPEAYGALVR
jgi:predicted amidohydrolase